MKRHRTDDHLEPQIVKKSINRFENFSNELILEIFDYLDYSSIYESFNLLNQRFQVLITRSSLPRRIHLPLISKTQFQHRYETIIWPNRSSIISLRVSHSFLIWFPLNCFEALEYLHLRQVPSEKFQRLLDELKFLPHLSSLSIESLSYFNDENSVYRSIFSLKKLKFCKFIFPTGGHRVPLALASDSDLSTLERLIIDGSCRLTQLISILSYTPKLRFLSCQCLDAFQSDPIEAIRTPTTLTHLHLKLYRMNFDQFETFLAKISSRLEVLRIRVCQDETFFHAQRWEKLIVQSMAHLSIFDFKYLYAAADDDNSSLQPQIDAFFTQFWIERRWFFDWNYFISDAILCLQFYSRLPYRDDNFTLIASSEKFRWTPSMNLTRHLIIDGRLTERQISMEFPRVKKLTLQDNFPQENSSLIQQINQIIPLGQIIELHIRNQSLSYDQICQLLSLTSNLQSLTLSDLSFFPADQQKEIANNKIVKLTIDDDRCRYRDLFSLIKFFPYLRCLELSIDPNESDLVMKLLCSTSNVPRLQFLCALCLVNMTYEMKDQLKTIIDRDNLLSNYTLERVQGGWYLWW